MRRNWYRYADVGNRSSWSFVRIRDVKSDVHIRQGLVVRNCGWNGVCKGGWDQAEMNWAQHGRYVGLIILLQAGLCMEMRGTRTDELKRMWDRDYTVDIILDLVGCLGDGQRSIGFP